MITRVTQLTLQRMMLANTNRVRQRLAQVQEQASSGLQINRPSDDPAGFREAAILRQELSSAAQLGRNIGQAEVRLVASEESLQEVTDVLIRARELAVQGANDTYDADGRLQIATEVEGLHGRLVAAGNTRRGGAYMFSGFLSATAPFAVSGPFQSGLPAPTVTFVGDANEIEIEIDDGVRIPATLDGRRVFLGDGDGDAAPDAGREDLFDVIADLRDALVADDRDAVAAVIDRIDRAQGQISEERARLGGVSARVDSQRSALARREEQIQTRLSQVQDADTVRVFSDLVREETVLQASLEATARVIQPTLLNFLR